MTTRHITSMSGATERGHTGEEGWGPGSEPGLPTSGNTLHLRKLPGCLLLLLLPS
jgi:hypothetical protein